MLKQKRSKNESEGHPTGVENVGRSPVLGGKPPGGAHLCAIPGRQCRTPIAERGVGNDVAAATRHEVHRGIIGRTFGHTHHRRGLRRRVGLGPVGVVGEYKKASFGVQPEYVPPRPFVILRRAKAEVGQVLRVQVVTTAVVYGHGMRAGGNPLRPAANAAGHLWPELKPPGGIGHKAQLLAVVVDEHRAFVAIVVKPRLYAQGTPRLQRQ